MKSAILTLALTLGSLSTLNAAVIFTASGTVGTGGLGDKLGYIPGQAVTFTFETSNAFGSYIGSAFLSNSNNWNDSMIHYDRLWNSITGTGLTGSYIRPTASYYDPYSSIETEPYDDYFAPATDSLIRIIASVGQTSNSIGFTGPSGSAISAIQLVAGTGFGFAFPETSVSLEEYFINYSGIWSLPTSGANSISLNDGSNYAHVKITSLSILVTPVPEPSSYALLGAIFSLGYAVMRRKRPAFRFAA